MKDSDKLDDFVMKISRLVSNIRALGETVSESYVVKKLLRAVPSKFLQIASTIEQFKNLETMSVEETVGSLKAHEERLKGQSGSKGDQLMLTEEEWAKRESTEGKLLLTKEEWRSRMARGSSDRSSNSKARWGGDKSHIRCYNFQNYGHYAGECKRPKKEREQKTKVNLSQTNSDEPSLLLSECERKEKGGQILLNAGVVIPDMK